MASMPAPVTCERCCRQVDNDQELYMVYRKEGASMPVLRPIAHAAALVTAPLRIAVGTHLQLWHPVGGACG